MTILSFVIPGSAANAAVVVARAAISPSKLRFVRHFAFMVSSPPQIPR
jgi:hypothetical protein